MSDVWSTLILTVPPTIAAIAAWAQAKQNGFKSDEIHVLVNSQLTAVKADLVEAKQKIRDLQDLALRLTSGRQARTPTGKWTKKS